MSVLNVMLIDINHIDDAFRHYIENRLIPRLERPLSGYRLEVPLSGKKSCLRILKGENGRGYVIRAFSRRNRKEARHLLNVDEILEKNNIPTPRIIDFAEDFSSRKVTFVTEEYLDGKIWSELKITPEKAKNLGDILARLHSVENSSWGKLNNPANPGGSFGKNQIKRVRHRIYRIRKFSPNTVSGAELKAVRDWFRAFRVRLDNTPKFQLIHDKLNGGNVLYSSLKFGLFLLDFATLHYGYRGKDIVQSELGLLKNDPDLIEAFHREYFSAFSADVKKEYNKLRIFYRAYFHLSRSAVNLRRDHDSRTRKHEFKTNYYDRFVTNWRALWEIIEGESIH